MFCIFLNRFSGVFSWMCFLASRAFPGFFFPMEVSRKQFF